MSYITVSDIKDSLKEVKDLAEGFRIQDGDIERWIEVSEGEIDSYCASRYRLPFRNMTTNTEETPPLIRSLVKQLTQFYFLEDQGRAADERDRIHRRVIKVLEKIQSGEQALVDTDKTPIPPDSRRVDVVDGNRLDQEMIAGLENFVDQSYDPEDYR